MGRRCKQVADDIAEEFCFVCKDGGEVRVCGFKNCLKAYHPRCVGKEDDFLSSNDQFTCDCHKCAHCKGNALYECFCCPTSSTCQDCLGKVDFVPLKEGKGFCSSCLSMAIVTEKDAGDEQPADAPEPEDYELLFKDYWEVIKGKECLTLLDLQAASILLKRQNCKESRDSDEHHNTDGQSLGNDDAGQTFLLEPMDKPSEVQAPPKRKKSNKKTYVGWASKELTEFLSCIGKDSTKPLDHYGVTRVVREYIQQNLQENTTTSKPFVPSKSGQKENKKKKSVDCDVNLHSLFGKNKVKLNMIHSLLETHLAVNAISEDESDGSGDDYGLTVKKKPRNCLEPKVLNKVSGIDKRCVAALNQNNLNLIYLRRTLVVKLLSELDTFHQKVVGCFVRVKNDVKSYTYMMTKKHFQLGLVTGIKKSSEEYKINKDNKCTDILLCVSSMLDDVKISSLSDEDIEEDECKDLLLSAKKDHFKRPTVAELEEKEASVHADIVNHWIDRELQKIENELERAHVKGWRQEFYDLSCRKKVLSTPVERQRRLEEIPEIIPDAEESKDPETEPAASGPVQGDQGSRRNIAACLKDAEEISKDAAKQLPVSLEFIIDEPREAKQLPVSLKDIIEEQGEDAVEQLDYPLEVAVEESREGVTQQVADSLEVGIDESPEGASLRNSAACEVAFEDGGTTQVINIDSGKDENGSRHHVGCDKEVINLDSDDDEDLHMEQRVPERATCGAPEATNGIAARTHHAPEAAYELAAHKHDAAKAINGVTVPTVCASKDLNGITVPAVSTSQAMTDGVAPARITLNGATESLRMWHYIDPTGKEQGPHSMDQMRKWQEAGYFDQAFLVWRTGQTRRKAILLVEAMRMTF
ncbi:zinc finger CCCH domain-containing protein 19 isoform X3 [Lolium perenne]|uniref:zinc finger CCCH domain-containing protein 19 isoform X3 n=1 Tax=Lolium perenne TaxID=4522 RepID=UPI0021F63F7C|nr:zinc finger CCCH domain-containing protein 44-like isoform X3 [Lolium perenne]